MPTLYESNKKGFLLYPNHNHIILRQKLEHIFGQPVIVADDYAYGHCDTVFNSTIYYAYINTSGHLFLKSILEQTFSFQLQKPDDMEYLEPAICVFSNQLVLFYVAHSLTENHYSLHCMLPYQDKRKIMLTDKVYPQIPTYQISTFPDALILTLYTADSTEIFSCSNTFLISLLYPLPATHEDTIHSLQEELEITQNKLSKKNAEIKHLQNQIQSATSQYNELKHVAEQYRAEAIKWSSKYLG